MVPSVVMVPMPVWGWTAAVELVPAAAAEKPGWVALETTGLEAPGSWDSMELEKIVVPEPGAEKTRCFLLRNYRLHKHFLEILMTRG